LLRRAGLRIQEARLSELDLDRRRGSVLVRRGKRGRQREVGVHEWGFERLEPWPQDREQMPVGPLFCVINGRTCGRAWRSRGVPLNVMQRQFGYRNPRSSRSASTPTRSSKPSTPADH